MNEERVELLGDTILVIVDQPKDNPIGLYMPENLRATHKTGVVVGIGDEVNEIRKYSKVAFHNQTGRPTNVAGQNYLIMRERDVLMSIA